MFPSPHVERKTQGEGNKTRGTSDPNQPSQGLSKTASSTPAPIIFPFPSPWSRLPTDLPRVVKVSQAGQGGMGPYVHPYSAKGSMQVVLQA